MLKKCFPLYSKLSLAVAVALAVPLTISTLVGASETGGGYSFNQLQAPLEDVEFQSLHGGSPVRLSSLQGKIVLINYWTTWCPYKNFPGLLEAAKAYPRAQLEILNVLVDTREDKLEEARKILSESGLSGISTNVILPGGHSLDTDPVAGVMLRSVPMIVVLNKSGYVVSHLRGEHSLFDMRQRIKLDALVKEPMVPMGLDVFHESGLPKVDGSGNFRIKDLKGKPILMTFWASWLPAGPIDVLSELKQKQMEFEAQGLQIATIEVSPRFNAPEALEALKRSGLDESSVNLVGGGGMSGLQGERLLSIPMTYLLDANGKVVRMHRGSGLPDFRSEMRRMAR